MSKLTTYYKPSTSSPQVNLESFTLKRFDDIDTSSPVPNKIGAIPVTVDSLNNNRIHDVVTKVSKESNGNDINKEVDDSGLQNSGDDELRKKHNEYEPTKFTEVKEFKPQSLLEQLLEVGITGLEDLNRSTLEQVLNYLINGDEADHDEISYKWTSIDEIGKVLVFVRFDTRDAHKAVEKIQRLLKLEELEFSKSKLNVILEENTIKFVEDTIGKRIRKDDTRIIESEEIKDEAKEDEEETGKEDDKAETQEKDLSVDKDSLIVSIERLLQYQKNQKQTSSTEMDYVVDVNELNDLPKEALPQLIRDIKDFRLKVIEKEKKKREKETQEEIKRSRLQLRKLFDKFKSDSGEIVEDDEDSEEEEDEEDGDSITDEQREEQRIAKENADILKRYAIKQAAIQSLQRRNNDLIEQLNYLSSYESSLDKTVKPEYEAGKFEPSNRDKLLELEKDKQDRIDALKEEEASKQSENFLASINIPLKVSLNTNSHEDGIKSLDEDELDLLVEKVKPKIESYIEEFLGVKEDELLDYIVTVIKDTKEKDTLVEELKEAFDDDAVKIGNKIWDDLINGVEQAK